MTLEEKWELEDTMMIDATIKALLENNEGKRFLWWLLKLGNLFHNAYVSGDSHATAFRLGEQNVMQQILGKISVLSPEGWFNLQKEMEDVRRIRARAAERRDTNGRDA